MFEFFYLSTALFFDNHEYNVVYGGHNYRPKWHFILVVSIVCSGLLVEPFISSSITSNFIQLNYKTGEYNFSLNPADLEDVGVDIK
jgi:hypothetical protein